MPVHRERRWVFTNPRLRECIALWRRSGRRQLWARCGHLARRLTVARSHSQDSFPVTRSPARSCGGDTGGADGVASGLVAPADHWDSRNKPSEPGAVNSPMAGECRRRMQLPFWRPPRMVVAVGRRAPTRGDAPPSPCHLEHPHPRLRGLHSSEHPLEHDEAPQPFRLTPVASDWASSRRSSAIRNA